MWGSGGSNYAYGFYGAQRELENHGVSSNVNWNRYYNGQEVRKGYGTQLHARTSAPHCARFNGPAERVGVFRTVQRETPNIDGPSTRRTNGSRRDVILEQLNVKYRGLTFLKDFEQFGVFTGTIKEVWRHENLTFFALVVYKEDGDWEDIPVSEVERLLQRKDFHSGYNSKRAELGNGVLVLGRERAVGVKFACDVSCVRVMALEQTALKVQHAEFSTQETLVFELAEIPSADVLKQHGIARDNISGGTFHCSRLIRKAVAGPPGLPGHGLKSADADILLVESEYEQKLTHSAHVCVELGSTTALEPVEVNTTESHMKIVAWTIFAN